MPPFVLESGASRNKKMRRVKDISRSAKAFG